MTLEQRGNVPEITQPVVGTRASEMDCDLIDQIVQNRSLIIASNRAPVKFQKNESGQVESRRGRGGLVTALTGLASLTEAHWIACADTDEDKAWRSGAVPLEGTDKSIEVQFLSPDASTYDRYYNGIANPILWFLQHSMLDITRSPSITQKTWEDWNDGYVAVNEMFAEAIARQINISQKPSLVMLQDYHLYLAARLLRKRLPSRRNYTLLHFIHIPWPGAEDWGLLPSKMRTAILDGLCAADLLGFQTREDGLNFLRTCESYLPRSYVRYKHGRIWYRNHMTYVRDFPISIDVDGLRKIAETAEVQDYRQELSRSVAPRQLVIRIDRIEPSKNIVRGFEAFDEMLELFPEHKEKVQFLALLVPSRLEMDKYQDYLAELMAVAGKINVKYGNEQWEPIRILTGENYPRAVAAMTLYDALLVNSIADGMNLVAKEGPVVNQREGVLILSERAGAYQQLEPGALVIPPLDIYATAEAIHQALVMPLPEKQERAARLRHLVEGEDIVDWLCLQLEQISKLGL
jgi:trehalose 6-phosphate synthase